MIEKFYEMPIAGELLRQVRQTPLDQLIELADRVTDRRQAISDHLRRRRLIQAQFHLSAPVKLPASPIHVSDEFYFGASSRFSIMDSPNFKHWFLFSDNLVAIDDVFGWAMRLHDAADLNSVSRGEEAEQQIAAARAIAPLIELKPMCGGNGLLLLPGVDAFDPFVDDLDIWPDPYPLEVRFEQTQEFGEILMRDPYLAWVLVNRVYPFPKWQRRVLELADPQDLYELAEIVLESNHPHGQYVWNVAHPGDSMDEYERSVGLGIMQREASLTPIASTKLAREHLLKCSAVSLGALSSKELDKMPLESAIRLGIPNLAAVSLTDLVALRKNDELLADCRAALLEISDAVDAAPTGSHASLQRSVYEAAESIASTRYESLRNDVRRSTWFGKIAGVAAGASLSLGLNALGAFLGGAGAVGSRPVASGTSNAVNIKIQKMAADRSREKRVAMSLLMSCLPPENY